jgi:hypothetical protein
VEFPYPPVMHVLMNHGFCASDARRIAEIKPNPNARNIETLVDLVLYADRLAPSAEDAADQIIANIRQHPLQPPSGPDEKDAARRLVRLLDGKWPAGHPLDFESSDEEDPSGGSAAAEAHTRDQKGVTLTARGGSPAGTTTKIGPQSSSV